MKREYMKYVDKPTWCETGTCWGKNCEEYVELKIKDMDENEKLYSDCNTKAFVNTKQIEENIEKVLKNKFDTKYIATLYFTNGHSKYIALKGIDIRIENRIKGDYLIIDKTVLNSIDFGTAIARVRMCEDEQEVIKQLFKGNFQNLNNYNNLEFHNVDDIEGIKKSIIFNILAISNEHNIIKNYIIGDISKKEKLFLSNLMCFKHEIKNTHDYIKEFNEVNCISLREIGEKHSIELANIMFELGYAGWHFQDFNDFEKIKEQMIETIDCDYYSEENAINHGSTKEKIIEDIKKCDNKVLSEEGKDILKNLNITYLEENIEEDEEENEF